MVFGHKHVCIYAARHPESSVVKSAWSWRDRFGRCELLAFSLEELLPFGPNIPSPLRSVLFPGAEYGLFYLGTLLVVFLVSL